MFIMKLTNNFFIRLLICSVSSAFFLALFLFYFINSVPFSFFDSFDLASFMLFFTIFSLIYLVIGAPIQFFFSKSLNNSYIKNFVLFFIVGFIVNLIFFPIATDLNPKFYLDQNFYYMIISSSVIFWLNDLIFLRINHEKLKF
ncbi:hypothetical protein CHI02_14190 [Niallia circulans]|jgi:hypothetical protein|nr:hypothetical protein CHI02_14190 [Niallia circulans]